MSFNAPAARQNRRRNRISRQQEPDSLSYKIGADPRFDPTDARPQVLFTLSLKGPLRTPFLYSEELADEKLTDRIFPEEHGNGGRGLVQSP